MSETMRAIRFHEWGTRVAIDEIPLPRPRPGQTLVRIEAAAVAHLDTTVSSGSFLHKPAMPYVGGVEGCGVVVKSRKWRPGTRVVLRGGGLGLTRDGTWSEYVAADNQALTVAPAGLSPELAACYFNPATTALVSLVDVARLGTWFESVEASKEVVVVTGATGAVGSLTVQLALTHGCSVIACVSRPDRAARVPAGVEVISAADAVRSAELTSQRPGTLLIDTVGGPGLSERVSWIRPGGRAVLVGYTAGTQVVLDLPNWLSDDVAYLPVNMLSRDARAQSAAANLAYQLSEGQLSMALEVYDFDSAQAALDTLCSGAATGKIVIKP